MIFAMQELPGEFTTFDFIPGIPAPFNFGLAILKNQKMLTLLEKIQTAPPLIPMLIEGQPFIDAQVLLHSRSLCNQCHPDACNFLTAFVFYSIGRAFCDGVHAQVRHARANQRGGFHRDGEGT